MTTDRADEIGHYLKIWLYVALGFAAFTVAMVYQ